MTIEQYIQTIDSMIVAMQSGKDPAATLFYELHTLNQKMIKGKGQKAKWEAVHNIPHIVQMSWFFYSQKNAIQRLAQLKAILLDQHLPYAF
jgi:hypothetical protein